MKTRTIRLRTYNLLFAWVYNNGRLLYTSYNGRIGKYEDVYLVGRGTWRCTRDRRGYVESVTSGAGPTSVQYKPVQQTGVRG